MTLPDFFIIGPPKAGTTALHAALAQHPELHLSRIKEPKYFLCGDRPPPQDGGPGDAHSYREWVWQRDRYEALFADAPAGTQSGESTPFYLSDLSAQKRIHDEIPDAKLIVILRDPVDRAYSNWTHLWSDGLEPIGNFLQACAEEDVRINKGWAPFWKYRQLGLYGEQLDHLFQLFPREQVHLFRYKELVDEPHRTLNRICEFLGVTPDVVTEVPRENVSTFVEHNARTRVLQAVIRVGAEIGRFFPPSWWRRVSAPLVQARRGDAANRPELSVDDRLTLIEYFRPDIELLQELTGQSFADWLGHREGGSFTVRSAAAGPDRSVRTSWEPSGHEAS